MSDEHHDAPNHNAHASSDEGPYSASSLFVEMMRQMAAQQTPAIQASEGDNPAEVAQPIAPPVAQDTEQGTAAPTPDVIQVAAMTSDNTAEADETLTPATRPRRPRAPVPPPPDLGTGDATRDPSQDEARRAEQMRAQRIRRVKRRQERRRRRRVGMLGGLLRTLLVVALASGLASTIFTWFTDPSFIQAEVAANLRAVQNTRVPTLAPTDLPTPNWARRIGIVSGHRGPNNDPGAVCEDNGLTEAEINFAVAQQVVRELRGRGYSVDLLDEFDPRLNNYQAATLVSIHANSCLSYGGEGTGFLVARAAARPAGGPDELLAECIAQYYQRATQLERKFSLTVDMTDYHTFREIHPRTPAAIIELGFMLLDRDLLLNQQDVLAHGIAEGVVCFLEGDGRSLVRVSPTPTVTPTPIAISGG